MGEVWERGWVVTIAQAGGSVEGVEVVKVGFALYGARAPYALAERTSSSVPVWGRGWNGGEGNWEVQHRGEGWEGGPKSEVCGSRNEGGSAEDCSKRYEGVTKTARQTPI